MADSPRRGFTLASLILALLAAGVAAALAAVYLTSPLDDPTLSSQVAVQALRRGRRLRRARRGRRQRPRHRQPLRPGGLACGSLCASPAPRSCHRRPPRRALARPRERRPAGALRRLRARRGPGRAARPVHALGRAHGHALVALRRLRRVSPALTLVVALASRRAAQSATAQRRPGDLRRGRGAQQADQADSPQRRRSHGSRRARSLSAVRWAHGAGRFA